MISDTIDFAFAQYDKEMSNIFKSLKTIVAKPAPTANDENKKDATMITEVDGPPEQAPAEQAS